METRINIDSERERRFFDTTVEFEVRADGESNTLVGYGAVFNSNSQDLGGFIERIEPGAFDDVMDDDVYGLLNHNTDKILGRNKRNMKLTVDEKGLKYRIELPDTSTAKEVRTLVKDGIIDKSSFAFEVKEQRWEHRKGLPSIRSITKFKRLYDVSPVAGPAYLDTSVSVRSYQKEIENNKPSLSLFERERQLKIKLNKTK
jgi:HK97 family phage prohead protease